MSDLKLDVDQASELKAAFRRTRGSNGEEWTNTFIKELSEGNHLGLFLDYLHGRATLVPVTGTCEVATVKPTPKVYLRNLYPNEVITLGADDGTRMLADASGTFKAGVDGDFKNWKLNKKRSAKPAVNVRVCELIEDGKFTQIFGSVFNASPNEMEFDEFVEKHREDLRKLYIAQGQVEEFAVKHRGKLRGDGWGTFFLTEVEDTGEFFVVYVYVRSDVRLLVFVYELEDDFVWCAGGRDRFVFPQLAEAQ